MDFFGFRASLKDKAPPEGLSHALQALWWDAQGDWDKAHQCAQANEDDAGNWVHAYLHRKEGDMRNAGGWYRRARKPVASGTLDDEWSQIAKALLQAA